MKMHHGFNMNRASRYVIASMALAACIAAAGIARADDTTQQPDQSKKAVVVKKQDVATKDSDKNAKAISDSASKLDLSTPVSKLNFYGTATVGYETTFGKSACTGKISARAVCFPICSSGRTS